MTETSEMSVLTERKAQLEQEISKLTFEDSSLSSLSLLEQRAKQLGFIPNTESLLSLEVDTATTIAAIANR